MRFNGIIIDMYWLSPVDNGGQSRRKLLIYFDSITIKYLWVFNCTN